MFKFVTLKDCMKYMNFILLVSISLFVTFSSLVAAEVSNANLKEVNPKDSQLKKSDSSPVKTDVANNVTDEQKKDSKSSNPKNAVDNSITKDTSSEVTKKDISTNPVVDSKPSTPTKITKVDLNDPNVKIIERDGKRYWLRKKASVLELERIRKEAENLAIEREKARKAYEKLTLEEDKQIEDYIGKDIDLKYSTLEDLNLLEEDLKLVKGNPESYVAMFTDDSVIVIELFPNAAPRTVKAFKQMVRDGVYNETEFFRMIPNYIVQAGDPTNSAYGGTGKTRKAEINKKLKFQRGTIAMANSGDLTSDDSQFFITFNKFSWLDGKSTIFGRLISGIDYLESIQGNYNSDGFLTEPVVVNKVMVVADFIAKQK